MNPIVKRLKRVKFVYRQSSMLSKVAVLSVIVVALAVLLTLHLSISAAQDRTAELADQAAALEQKNQELRKDIDCLGSADSVGKIAEDELDMVDPDKVVIDPK